jgi:HEAT repeat protein
MERTERSLLRRAPLVLACLAALVAAAAWCGAEEVDPDVLRKVRKLINGTLAEDNTEREKGWAGLKEMGNLAVPALIELQREKSTTAAMTRSIIIALGDSKDPRAGPALTAMLSAREVPVRRDAARALGDVGYKDAHAPLEQLATSAAENEDVRLHAAVAGVRLGSAKALDALAELMRSPRAEIRSRAVYALGRHGGPKQAATLAKALDDQDRDVREDAVAALRLIAKKEAWGPLVKAAADSDYKIRNAAMEALREVTGARVENDPKAWNAWWTEEQKKPEAVKE